MAWSKKTRLNQGNPKNQENQGQDTFLRDLD